MLDRVSLQLVKPILTATARGLVKVKLKADTLTMTGFFIGLSSIPLLASQHYLMALILIALNRIFDGLDGAVARLTKPTERGAYLDIVLDFIFYSGVIFGFALAMPERNALPAVALLFSFMGTGSSFLAFAIFAEKLNLHSLQYPNKGFYYLSGMTEGTETIFFLVAMCLLPNYFPWLAWSFFTLCMITTLTRVIGGAHTIRVSSRQ